MLSQSSHNKNVCQAKYRMRFSEIITEVSIKAAKDAVDVGVNIFLNLKKN
jgi:hypothetical protein